MRFQNTGAQVLYGITEQLKFNPSMLTVSKKVHVLHLSLAKPDIVETVGLFQAAHDGTRVDAGGFVYESPSGVLRLVNAEACSGLVEDTEENTFAIPISYVPRSAFILSNIYGPLEQITPSG